MTNGFSIQGQLWNMMNKHQRFNFMSHIWSKPTIDKHIDKSWNELPDAVQNHIRDAFFIKLQQFYC